jgi:hypothetical protein
VSACRVVGVDPSLRKAPDGSVVPVATLEGTTTGVVTWDANGNLSMAPTKIGDVP